ncbi:cytochrome c oxidase subunit II [candidate division KSB1 bacterium]|nr:cytochrome c oxidase subunit II [candidate division KSB1 bacterium]NIR69309.1 cytochrome c oxidase subunit II [candidate division KSB1 bacterium]NIS22715.1 cytochrome c oxidase subunit II [candidate division KSB1 bacterium]NIT69561.1 cytochrome c oxidase subunit II [candidate division KSB1 bacterium]NIU23215.1 cytochrome c oxidase subunit II [candidate division KSB1 bacterium]
MLDWLPPNVSTFGGDIDKFFYVIYYITLVVFVLVAATMVYFLIKYRYKEGRKAKYYHGNNTLEIIWTSATFIAMIVLALVSRPVWSHIKQELPISNIVVQVTGKQFNWEMLYPGPDGIFGTEDDYRIDNQLHVPEDRVVHVVLKSEDVIHSFFVPSLRLKQDAVPGREITAWFEASEPGKYEIPCAELCGFGHSGMLGYLYVHTADDYENWVKQTWPES